MTYTDINIDFTVTESWNPATFLVDDNSYWQVIKDKPAIIEIETPGGASHSVNVYTKEGRNNFNSVNLGLNCPTGDCEDVELLPLPDGIYTITVKGSPDSFRKTKKYLRTTNFRMKLMKYKIELYSSMCDVCEKMRNKVIDMEMLLDAAAANIMEDNCKEAQRLFYKAQEMLNTIKECKTCR